MASYNRFLIIAVCAFYCMAATTDFGNDGDGTPETPYRVTRASGDIIIDGKLDETAWQDALTLELKYEVRPGDNITPPVRTIGYITYSATHLLVGFRCFDDHPDDIRSRYRDRDTAWPDDWVGVVLDTFNDERRAYEFIVNPYGVQMDAINDEVTGNYSEDWNAIWNSAGSVTDKGYEVEIAIPWHQLRFPAGSDVQTWGIDYVRSLPRNDRHHIGLFPRDRDKQSYLSQTVKISGFEGVETGRNIEIVPTITSQRSESRDTLPFDPLVEDDSSSNVGLTARWGITPNISLQGTVNPDFSQIEADSVQLDINETFALYFPETRPFFLEGSDFFEVPRMQLVYTRAIADPDNAVKVTGKQGNHTFGLFTAQDTQTNIIIPGSQESSSEIFNFNSVATVGRYRYDFGGNSTIGASFTDRQGSDYYNRVFAVDSVYRFTQSDNFRTTFAGSTTQYNGEIADTLDVDTESSSGYGFSARYAHSDRDWFWQASYDDFSDDFRADLGFVTQVGIRRWLVGGQRTWWPEKGSFLRRFWVYSDFDQAYEQDGELLESEFEVSAGGQGPMQSSFWVGVGTRERVYEGISFDQQYWDAGFNFRPSSNVFFGSEVEAGEWIDFDHTRSADRFNYNLYLGHAFGRHLNISLNYSYGYLDVEPGRLFTTNVLAPRIVYQFNTRTFVRLIMQYVDITRDPALYADEDTQHETKDLLTQFLFSYKINPQTVLYLGYGDTREANDSYDLTQANRTVFFKLSYAWLQ